MTRARKIGHRFQSSHKSFEHRPIESKVALLSVPKCGTLMVRNILAHFVPADQMHIPFIDTVNVANPGHPIHEPVPRFFTGHVAYTVRSAVALRGCRILALVRDPVDFVLSQAHFLLTAERRAGGDPLPIALHHDRFGHPEVIPLIICGTNLQGRSYGGVAGEFHSKAMTWVAAAGATLVRYEDVRRHARSPDTDEAREYFERLIGHFNMPLPEDWKERVRAGAAREISTTASEGLEAVDRIVRQKAITRAQFRLLETAAPGLRAALGYREPPAFQDQE